jgi:hypothetical protein
MDLDEPFLGWNVEPPADPLAWPSQSDLVQVYDVTRQRIGQIITAWLRNEHRPAVT